ncbi:MAG: DUF5702 domain-containing protein [Lachnospiraceae bacterium]
MRIRGQITVFLSLILLCILSLLCGLLESARMAGGRLYLQTALHSSMDSLFSRYHRQVWDDYRILVLEYTQPDQAKTLIKESMEEYLEAENWYPAVIEQVELTEEKRMTDDGGQYLRDEIMDYMEYGIWDMDISLEEADQLQVKLKEGMAVSETMEDYGTQTVDMFRLEETAEDLGILLEQINQNHGEALERLTEYDGSQFLKIAGKMKRDLKRVPGLVAKYEKQAEGLEIQLVQWKARAAQREGDLSSEVRGQLVQELDAYDSYIAEDGTRRQEIRQLEEWSEAQIQLLEQVMEEAREAQDYLDSWEGGEEEEEPDPGEIWAPVNRHFQEFQKKSLGSPRGVADKEKQHALEQVKQWTSSGLMQLVLPEGANVSQGVMDQREFPSKEFLKETQEDSWKETLPQRLLCAEYGSRFYSNFLGEEQKEIQYELEYIIHGGDSDQENLGAAAKKILQIRQGLNLLYLLSDGTKRAEARELAAVIVGAAGMLPLVSVMTFFILCVWALGEAVLDVKTLLSGRKIPLWKSQGDWKLSLEHLLAMGRGEDFGGGSEAEGTGLSYLGYLKILLFLTDTKSRYYRMMDMIQLNIRREQDDFRIKNCGYGMGIQVTACGKHVFFSPRFVDNQAGDFRYQFHVEAEKQY